MNMETTTSLDASPQVEQYKVNTFVYLYLFFHLQSASVIHLAVLSLQV